MHRLVLACLVIGAAGCGDGPQSSLAPAGRDAEIGAHIFFVMSAAFALVWLGVVALSLYAPHARESRRAQSALILGGGVGLPLAVLTSLLVYTLRATPAMLAPARDNALTIHVEGNQWWWRVRYMREDGRPVELANEMNLPVGRRINVFLTSADVIHSFWIPSLAGKLDLIPGRVNRLSLEPTRAGAFRGACAEFCGTAHARMNLVVNVVQSDAFDAWLDAQARPAALPAGPDAERGRQVFFERGCVACHAVRGTTAVGMVGPDLTHLASRATIAAGTLTQNRGEIRRWIADVDAIKPGALMPSFRALPSPDLDALAAYLSGLE